MRKRKSRIGRRRREKTKKTNEKRGEEKRKIGMRIRVREERN